MPIRRLRHHMRTEDIVAKCLAHLFLQQGHMLEGSGVEDDLRAGQREHALATNQITAIADPRIEQQIRKLAPDLLFDPVKIVFGQFENRQRRSTEPGYLTTQFRSDRTATAGDQHALAGNTGADRCPVELHLLAAEQILDRDLLQLTETRTSGNDISQTRHGSEWQSGFLAETDHALHLRTVRRGHRDQQHLCRRLASEVGQLAERAEHGHAMDARTADLRVVIEHADDAIAILANQSADKAVASASCTEYEYAQSRRPRQEIEAAVLPVAIGEARKAEQDGENHRIQQKDGSRHRDGTVVKEQGDADRQRTEDCGTPDIPQIRQAGESPQALVQAGNPEDHTLRKQNEANLGAEQAQLWTSHLE